MKKSFVRFCSTLRCTSFGCLLAFQACASPPAQDPAQSGQGAGQNEQAQAGTGAASSTHDLGGVVAGSPGPSTAPSVAGDGGRASVRDAGTDAGATATGVPFDAGSDPDRNRVQPGELCGRLATIQCAAEAHCCLAPGRSVEACENDIRAMCNDELYLDQIAANAVTGFDAAATAAAFTELEARSARCDLDIAAWSLTAAGLRGILKGTREAGASCKPSGTLAVTDKQAQAAALASCTNIEHYACLPMSLLGDWTCAAKSDIGGTCVTDDNCRADMYCHTPTMAPLGKCAQRLELGSACVNGNDCSSLYCKTGRCVAAERQVVFCLQ